MASAQQRGDSGSMRGGGMASAARKAAYAHQRQQQHGGQAIWRNSMA